LALHPPVIIPRQGAASPSGWNIAVSRTDLLALDGRPGWSGPGSARSWVSGTGANRQPDAAIGLILAAATLTSPGFDIYFLQFMFPLNAKEFGLMFWV
jgi:hypothetical protein